MMVVMAVAMVLAANFVSCSQNMNGPARARARALDHHIINIER